MRQNILNFFDIEIPGGKETDSYEYEHIEECIAKAKEGIRERIAETTDDKGVCYFGAPRKEDTGEIIALTGEPYRIDETAIEKVIEEARQILESVLYLFKNNCIDKEHVNLAIDMMRKGSDFIAYEFLSMTRSDLEWYTSKILNLTNKRSEAFLAKRIFILKEIFIKNAPKEMIYTQFQLIAEALILIDRD